MKKQHPLKLSIPTPCHENWNEMSEADKGRFCQSCQKTVLDFTDLSDARIVHLIEEKKSEGEQVCGRFRSSQLERNLQMIQTPVNPFVNKAAGLLVASLLTGGALDAQHADQDRKVGIIALEQRIEEPELIGEIAEAIEVPEEVESFILGDVDSPPLCTIPPVVPLSPEEIEGLNWEEQQHYLTGIVAFYHPPEPPQTFWQRFGLQWRQWWTNTFNRPKVQPLMPELPEPWPEAPGLKEANKVAGVEVYPNPFVHVMSIRLTKHLPGTYRWQLIDGSGKLLSSNTVTLEEGEDLIRLDWSDLPLVDGMYFLRLQEPSGRQSMHSLFRNGSHILLQP